jgi:hypothetical protein
MVHESQVSESKPLLCWIYSTICCKSGWKRDFWEMHVENELVTPRLIERLCGGQRAVFGAGVSLRGGATSETETAAVELFNSMIRRWRHNLIQGKRHVD